MKVPSLLAPVAEYTLAGFLVLVLCVGYFTDGWANRHNAQLTWQRLRRRGIKIVVWILLTIFLCWLPFALYVQWVHENHRAWCYGFWGNLFGLTVLWYGAPVSFWLQGVWLKSPEGDKFLKSAMG